VIRRHDFEGEAESWIELYNDSFAQHWQFTPVTRESYFHFRRHDPRFQPEHNWVIVAPDGTFAAFCWCLFNREQLAKQAERDALLHQIGTRPHFRGMGLGSVLIQHTINALCADPLQLHGVRLWVDIENVTNAKRLYEAHGFRDDYTLGFYQKVLRA
jgi:ribosomal protein S18 acetylase RimI-like enzyme